MADSVHKLLLEVVGASEDASRELATISTEIAAFGRTRATATVNLDVRDARLKLGQMESQLRRIDRTRVSPEVSARISGAVARLSVLQGVLNRLDGSNVKIGGDVRRGLLTEIAGIEREVASLGGSFRDTDSASHSFGAALGGITERLKDIQPIVTGVAIVIGITLVSAIAALVASAASAVAGLILLANSLVAALGPAVILIVGLFQRFAAVLGAKNAIQSAANSATRAGAGASNDAADALEREHNATNAVRDAKQALTRAQRDYEEAVKRARQEIRDAARDEKDAARDEKDAAADRKRAAQDVRDARIEAGKAIREAIQEQKDAETNLAQVQSDSARAIEDANTRVAEAQANVTDQVVAYAGAFIDAQKGVRDSIIGVKDAQLDLEDAQDHVTDVQKEINDLLKSMGSIDPTEALKKLQDVDLTGFDTSGLSDLGLSGNDAQAEKLSDLMRELAHAQLDAEKAANKVTDATDEQSQAQALLNSYIADGINAYKPYTDAVKSLQEAQRSQTDTASQAARDIRDAQRDLAAATKDANELRDQGIRNAPGVVSAYDSLANATRRLEDAQRQHQDAEKKLRELRQQGIRDNPAVIAAAEGVRDANERLAEAGHDVGRAFDAAGGAAIPAAGAFALAAEKVGDLSDAEREFLKTLLVAGAVMRDVLQPATDAVFSALTDAFKTLGPLLVGAKAGFTNLGEVWADSIRRGADALNSPIWRKGLQSLLIGAGDVSRQLADSFGAFAGLLRNLAVAALPDLIGLLRDVSKTFGGWERGTRDTAGLQDVIHEMVEDLRAWLRFIGEITVTFASFVKIAAPFGREFLGWLTDIVKGWGEWLRSDAGQERLKQFFEDTIPLAKSVVVFIGKLGLVFAEVFEFMAPALTDLFKGLDQIADIVIWVLEQFNKLPKPVKALIGTLLLLVTGIGGARVAVKGFEFVMRELIAAIVLIGRFGSGAFGGLKAAFFAVRDAVVDAFDAVVDFFKKLPGRVADAFKSGARALLDVGRWAVEQIVNGISAEIRAIADIGGWLVDKFTDLINREARGLKNIGEFIINTVVDGVKATASVISDGVAWIVEQLTDFINREIRGIKNIGSFIVDKIRDGLKAVGATVLGDAAGWVVDKLLSGIKAEISGLHNIGSYVIDKIRDGAKSVASIVGDIGAFLRDALFDKIRDAVGTLHNIGEYIVDRIRDGAKAVGGIVADIGAWIRDQIEGKIHDAIGVFHDVGSYIVDKIRDGALAVGQTVAAIGAWVRDQIETKLHEAVGTFTSVGGWVVDKIKDGVLGAGKVLEDAAKWIKDKIVGAVKKFLGIKSPSRAFMEIGKHVAGGLVKGILDGNILDFMKAHIGDMKSLAFDLIKGGVIDVPVKLIGKIAKKLGLSRKELKKLLGLGGDIGIPTIPLPHVLAAGGVATGATFGLFGEVPGVNEAVLPLTRDIFDSMARSIVKQMAVQIPALSVPSIGAAGIGGSSAVHYSFPITVPGGGAPDERALITRIDQEIKSRGGGGVNG